jgi:hypothetical protein
MRTSGFVNKENAADWSDRAGFGALAELSLQAG